MVLITSGSDSGPVARLPTVRAKKHLVRSATRQRSRRLLGPIKGDKNAARAERMRQKQNYEDAMSAVREIVWSHAVKLHEQFPSHTSMWHYRGIMQQGKRDIRERKISPWAAYLSLRTKQKNAGEFIMSSLQCTTVIDIASRNGSERHQKDVSRNFERNRC